MKMKYMGYTERKIQVRAMTIGDMLVSLAETLVTTGNTNIPIRFLETDTGDYNEFDNMNEMLTCGWNTSWKINVLKFSMMMDTETKENKYFFIVFESNEEE